jgi:malonyl-CoA/methylmalonyl-CoA synthetase
LDVEKEILGLDYISEVMVVGVDSEETGQSIAAAVVLTGVNFSSF